jgi:AraC-like DNA-binding protein
MPYAGSAVPYKHLSDEERAVYDEAERAILKLKATMRRLRHEQRTLYFKGKTRSLRTGGSAGGSQVKITPQAAKQIRELRAQGWKLIAIASQVGWSRSTVQRVLKQEDK